MPKNNKALKKNESVGKTFTVPSGLAPIQEDFTITTDAHSKFSKIHIRNQAIKFHREGNILDAEKYYQNFINLGYSDHKVFSNYGIILKSYGKLEEAAVLQERSIKIKPDLAEAHYNLANTLKDLGKINEAEISLRKAIKLKPDFVESYSNLGIILKDLGKLNEAEILLLKAIELNPYFAEAYSNLANVMKESGNFYDSINYAKKAIKLNNKLSIAICNLIELKGIICDWSDLDIQSTWMNQIGIYGSSINPGVLNYYEDNPLRQLIRSKRFFKQNYVRKSEPLGVNNNNKINVGYFSSDFRAHPTMFLISSLLSLHDKKEFNIYLYSFTPKDDEYTQMAKESGCIFRDIKDLNDIEVVNLARNDKIDIAVDLMGYIQNNRISIFSYRVAPIQINYLGYPGTLGADPIDYIIADKIIIPNEYEKFYSEKIIFMPNCYQCNDNKKEICSEPITREDFNLPSKGFVFTCFNSNKKITTKEFDIWMRLLIRVEGSVLWLFNSNEYSVENLYEEAKKRRVEKNRIIFASKLPLNKHLARHSLGDLGLDTFNYNGHTTTSDALWVGLPVLTKIGKNFAARVSASLLTYLGIPELITYDEREYEDKALYFARNPQILLRLKSKLEKSRKTSTLYNSELFARDLEDKFKELLKNH